MTYKCTNINFKSIINRKFRHDVDDDHTHTRARAHIILLCKIYICIYVCIQINLYVYMYTRTHTHTRAHTRARAHIDNFLIDLIPKITKKLNKDLEENRNFNKTNNPPNKKDVISSSVITELVCFASFSQSEFFYAVLVRCTSHASKIAGIVELYNDSNEVSALINSPKW